MVWCGQYGLVWLDKNISGQYWSVVFSSGRQWSVWSGVVR